MEAKDQAQFSSLQTQVRLSSEGTDIALPPHEHLIAPGPDGEPCTLAGFDRAGVMRAAAALQIWPPAEAGNIVIHGVVDQAWSGRGIGRSLLAWEEGRGRQLLSRLPGNGPASLQGYISEADAGRRRLLMAAGFSSIRSCYRVRRDLKAPIDDAALPAGLEWRGIDGVDSEAVMNLANQAATNGWAPGPYYKAIWDMRWPDYRPEWSHLVADAATGQLIGCSLVVLRTHLWAGLDRTEALIHRFGVLPEFRGLGVGRALLARTLNSIAGTGQRFVLSQVDSDRDQAEIDIHEAFGFSPAGRVIVYGLEL